MTDTELLFNNITPQNLKDNETIYKLLKLYNSSFEGSFDILENPLNLLDTDFLIKQYETTSNTRFDDIKREIFKIHLQEIFQTFEEIGDSEEIYKKFKSVYESLNISTDNLKIVADIDKSIDSQYLNASKSFKTKKGTKSGFFFVYDIINRAGIQSINSDAFFNLIEGTRENPNTPYEYTVETSLYKEVFKKTIVPLAHPVGFKWNFIRLLFLTLEDYFGLELTKTLGKTLLTCYGSSDTPINQIEIVDSGIYGTVKNFFITENQDKQEQIIIDYNPLDGTDGNGIRLLKDYNGSVIKYDRQSIKEDQSTGEIQYLDIIDVRLVQKQNGILSLNKMQRTFNDETFEVIQSIDFKEYTIINKDSITIEYRIKGDFEDKWNTVKLSLTNKVVSEDIKFFEPKTFTRGNIIDNSSSYNGRIVKDMGSNCLLTYEATYNYKVSTKDVSEHIESIRPNSINLKTNIKDINISQSEYDIAISEGRDPYEGLYCILDHTVQEIDFKDTHENFGRLSIGNIPRQFSPYKTNEHKIIGEMGLIIDDNTSIESSSDWRIDWHELHIQDIGFNSNDNRWENYFITDAQKDLDLINSKMSVKRYIKENTEWYGNKGSGAMPNNFGINFLPSTALEEQQLQDDIKTLSQDYEGVIKLENNGEYIAWESYTSSMEFNTYRKLINKEFTDEIHDIGDDIQIGDDLYYVGMVALYVTYIDAEPYEQSVTYTDNEISHTEVSSFNMFSDIDDFSFGVYKDGELLTDNNISAA